MQTSEQAPSTPTVPHFARVPLPAATPAMAPATPRISTCAICGQRSPHPSYPAPEMMHGSREMFEYFQCAGCGCLQIATVPERLGDYYGPKYYTSRALPHRRVIEFLKDRRLEYIATGSGIIGKLATLVWPVNPHAARLADGLDKDSRVLEVGCGDAKYLAALYESGYHHLYGIDPFIAPRRLRQTPFPIEAKTIHEMNPKDGLFDGILFNHSFEHIADQRQTLQKVRELLAPGGQCVIRVPYADSYAWEHYRTDWVQLDAPRHLFIHTESSARRLAESAGMKLARVRCDSHSLQFWGSEQYRQGISLHAKNSYLVNPGRSIFTPEQIAEYQARSEEYNRKNWGDQVEFIFKAK